MHVEVGPVPADSVVAYVAFAREVLAGKQAVGKTVGKDKDVDVDVAQAFEVYLAEWERVSKKGNDFRWEMDIDTETAEYLVHAFFRISTRVAEVAEKRGLPIVPQPAEAFYWSLVNGLLDALADEGEAAAGFATHLRSFWPGIPRD